MAPDSDVKATRFFSRTPMIVALTSFIVYLLTLSWHIYPGDSANLMALHTGIETPLLPTHPIWGFFVAIIAKIPLFSLPARLNLFSAIISAFTLALLYHLVSNAVNALISEKHSVRYAPVAARLAAIGSVVVLGSSYPFWCAATRLLYHNFDLLIILCAFQMLACFSQTRKLSFVWLGSLLFGAICACTPTLLFVAPIYAIIAALVIWRTEKYSVFMALVHAVWPLIVGVLFFLLIPVWIFTKTQDFHLLDYAGIGAVFSAMAKACVDQLRLAYDVKSPIVIFFVTVMPFCIALGVAVRTFNNERSVTQVMTHLALFIFCAIAILPFAISPMNFILKTPHVERYPVILYAMVALTSGYLFAYAYLLYKVRRAREGHDVTPFLSRLNFWVGAFLIPPLALIILGAGIYNSLNARGSRGAFADAFATELLDGLNGRIWFVTDATGLLDNHLRLLARERGQTFHLINLAQNNAPLENALLARTLTETGFFDDPSLAPHKDAMLNTLEIAGATTFLQDWLHADPNVAQKLAIYNFPDFWFINAGNIPLPEPLFYGGAADNTAAAAAITFEKSQAVWDRLNAILASKNPPRYPTDYMKKVLIRHLGFMANNTGFTLANVDNEEAAYQAFVLARTYDSENISALLNLALITGSVHTDKRQIYARELEQLDKDIRARKVPQYPLWSLSRIYGYVRSPGSFANLAMNWAVSGQTGAALSGLAAATGMLTEEQKKNASLYYAAVYGMSEKTRDKSISAYEDILKINAPDSAVYRMALRALVRLQMQAGDFDKAQTYLVQLSADAKIPRGELGLDWAMLYLAVGDTTKARLTLQQFIDLNPKAIEGWLFLGLMQLESDEINELRTTTLPRMELIAGKNKSLHVKILEAQLNMKLANDLRKTLKTPADLEAAKPQINEYLGKAREAYAMAAMLRQDNPRFRENVLWLDMELDDQKNADLHARQMIRIDRNNPLANYILGSILLSKEDYALAEDYLRRSIANSAPKPLYRSLNDLSEVLRRTDRLDEAITYATQATEAEPELYPAWETLASILLQADRAQEALPAIEKAIAITREDPRAFITQGRILVKLNRIEEARVAFNEAKQRENRLSRYERNDLNTLAKEVGR